MSNPGDRETWFGILTRQAIRRGSFSSVKELVLVAMIDAFTRAWNEGSGPFTWVKSADEILAKAVRKPRANSESGHSGSATRRFCQATQATPASATPPRGHRHPGTVRRPDPCLCASGPEREVGEGQEVRVQRRCGGLVLVVPDKEVADDLAGPADLDSLASPAPVVERALEQLKGQVEMRLEAAVIVAVLRPCRPRDLGADVRELVREAQPLPARPGQAPVEGGLAHPATRLSTTSTTCAWTAGSWMDLDRLTGGRRLTVESNSSQSGDPCWSG